LDAEKRFKDRESELMEKIALKEKEQAEASKEVSKAATAEDREKMEK